MKIAIHHREGSFSERWIAYCKAKDIPYKVVNCFDNDIIDQLQDCDALMWHHHHAKSKDVIAAKKILFSLEQAGVNVFPNFNSAWHFDDKVAQKYLLEAIGAPLVSSFVFYDKKEALQWVKETSFPKVFKLKGGASAANVSLVRTREQAIQKINKAFGKGFPQFDKIANIKEKYRKYKEGKIGLTGYLKSLLRFMVPARFTNSSGREKGYVYFQEFVPNNDHDIRIIIVDNKAFAIKRVVRKGDFRASGSGQIVFDREQINIECVKIAFNVNKKIKAQSIAYDFVFDQNGNPLIIEISYGFAGAIYDACEGYWDENLNWFDEKVCPQQWMVDGILKSDVTK